MQKETFDKLQKAFDDNDRKAVVDFFTDDATWDIPGFWTMKGIDEIRKFSSDNGIEVIESSRGRVVFNGIFAAAETSGKCRNAEGQVWENWCCDMYEFEGEKVKLLRSYVIDKK